jgi:hypothetical protein
MIRNILLFVCQYNTPRIKWIFAVCAMCLLSPKLAWARDIIDTDGPDFVESSETVGAERFQFEANALRETHHTNGTVTRITSTPTLLRLGVSKDWELRLETDGALHSETDDSAGGRKFQNGHADVSLGAKWHSHDRGAGTPAVAWLFHLDTPSGSREFQGHGIRPSLRSVITWDLSTAVSASVMPGLRYNADLADNRYVSGVFGAVIGKWWTPRFRTFVVFAGEQLARPPHGNVANWNIGTAYLLSKDWQLGPAFPLGQANLHPITHY